MNIYTNRLIEEWNKHNGILIGLDVDDTILPYRKDFTNTDLVIEVIKRAQIYGAKVILNTASHVDRYEYIKSYCESIGIKVEAINENIIFPFGDNRKIYANIYIDDRAGLSEALQILSEATEYIQLKEESNRV